MKKLFTLFAVLLVFSAMAAEKTPFGKIRQHEQVEKMLKDCRMAMNALSTNQLRVNASGYPDSAILYEHDGSSWNVLYHMGVRYANGLVSRIIFYQNLGSTNVPFFRYDFSYNGSGKTVMIEQTLTIPGAPALTAMRITMGYDAQGNQSSMLIYEEDNGTLALTEGDSLAITYNGNVPASALSTTYNADSSAWLPNARFTNITYGTNGHPTGIVMEYWDGTAFDLSERYSDLAWNLGFAGISATIGGLVDISNFLFSEFPYDQLALEYASSPTDFTEEWFENANWELRSKQTSTGPAGAITSILEQMRDNNAWVDDYSQNFTYTNGKFAEILYLAKNGSNWDTSGRISRTYDSQGMMTLDKGEFYVQGNWQTDYATRFDFDYTSDNRVYRFTIEEYDPSTSTFMFTEKREYYFGSFNLGVADQAMSSLKVYPNPVQDVLTIDYKANNAGKLQTRLFNINGQLVAQNSYQLYQGENQFQLDFTALPAGIYQLQLQGDGGTTTRRLVK